MFVLSLILFFFCVTVLFLFSFIHLFIHEMLQW